MGPGEGNGGPPQSSSTAAVATPPSGSSPAMFPEARATIEQAHAHKINDFVQTLALYGLVFLKNDAAGMAAQQKWLTDQPDAASFGFAIAGDTAAYGGHLQQARDLVQRGVDAAVRGDSKEFAGIIPGWATVDQRRHPVPSLIKAVSRASDWVRRMEVGECKHQRDLAKATKLEPRYINAILRVAFLAPEIVEAIIDGRQPPNLTLGSLAGVLPTSWQQQKRS